MFNVNLLNNPGKQVKDMDSKIIINRKRGVISNAKKEDVRISNKRLNNTVARLLLLLILCIVIGCYYLIIIL